MSQSSKQVEKFGKRDDKRSLKTDEKRRYEEKNERIERSRRVCRYAKQCGVGSLPYGEYRRIKNSYNLPKD